MVRSRTADGRLFGCYTYLLFARQGSDVYVKVGVSERPKDRLQEICCGLPFEADRYAFCFHGSRGAALKMERDLLKAYAKWSTRGEWLKMARADSAEFRSILQTVTRKFSTATNRMQWDQLSIPAFRKEQAEKRNAALAKAARRGYFSRPAIDFRKHVQAEREA